MHAAPICEPQEHVPSAGLWEQVVVPRLILDTCAENGWLLSTGEIAQIIGLTSRAISTRGDSFEHDIWSFRQIRRQGNCYVWAIYRTENAPPIKIAAEAIAAI